MSRSKFRHVNVDQKSMALLSRLDTYVKQNFDDLAEQFVTCFEEYCRKIIIMQQKERKGRIGFIHLSVLRTSILAKRHQIRLDAYDEKWYLDRNECSGVYDVSAFYQGLDELADLLEQARQQSLGRITFAEVQSTLFEESNKYLLFVAELVRVAIKKAVETESFQQMKRAEQCMVCIGGYQDRVDVLYKEDRTVKDAKEVKRYLEANLQPAYTYEICEQLDLSSGNFTDLKLMFSSFANCNFTDSSWKNSAILFSNFKQAIFKNTNLTETQIFDTDFSGAVFENVSFTGAKLKHVSFAGAKLVNVQFEGVLLVEQVQFDQAELIDTVIPQVLQERGE